MEAQNLEHLKQIDFSEEYLKEVEKTFMLRHEFGAIWYKFQGQNSIECFISGAWVMPEHRKKGVGAELIERLSAVAKENGSKFLVSQVDPKQPGAKISILSQIHLGFQLSPEIIDGKIIFFKELT